MSARITEAQILKAMRDHLIESSTRYTKEEILAMDDERMEHVYKTEFYSMEDWEADSCE